MLNEIQRQQKAWVQERYISMTLLTKNKTDPITGEIGKNLSILKYQERFSLIASSTNPFAQEYSCIGILGEKFVVDA